MVPLVGRSRPTIIRAIVVLPAPDSPTMASDRPCGRPKETSSTATNEPKCLRSPLTSRTAAPLPSAIGPRLEPTAKLVRPGAARHPAGQLDQAGHRGPADAGHMRAAGREGALRGRSLERRQRAEIGRA